MRKIFFILFGIIILTACGEFSNLRAQDVISFNVEDTKQTIDGFGGSIAYYENWLVSHSKRTMIYDALFKDLGISILRIRNTYMNESGTNQPMDDIKQVITEAKKRAPIDIMITSWSPPAKYKSNGKVNNEGTMATLATDTSGNFVYDDFAYWWYQSLLQYKKRNIDANYISIQNEPNFNPDYEGCILMPQEQYITDSKLDSTYKVASYATAFHKVYQVIDTNKANLNIIPKMIGPEVMGIENTWSGRPRDYTSFMDMSECYGVSHHLYTGGNETSPVSFVSNLTTIANDFPDKPKMQTEYYRGDWYATALLIHYCLQSENASAYLVWDLFWPGGGFIDLENPWTPGSWVNPNGFALQTKYYAMKQYSAFIKPGWKRIDATSTTATIKTTAFISPDGLKVTLVMINTSNSDKIVQPNPGLFHISGGSVYLTSASENCVTLGSYSSGTLTLPTKSVTTIVFDGEFFPAGSNYEMVNNCDIQVFPNPVSDESVLKISGYKSHAHFVILNLTGQVVFEDEISNNEPAKFGKYLPGGIYFIQVSDGVKQGTLKFEKL